jgi:hypothetical protein
MRFFKTPFPIGKIIQERIKMFFEPVFEPKMVDESYEFKLGRSAHLALKSSMIVRPIHCVFSVVVQLSGIDEVSVE